MTLPCTHISSCTDEIQREKWRVWRNVGFVSLSFMLFYAASGLVINLQSTINSHAGLGNASQSVIYWSQIISSFFISTLVMKKLGLKWAMVLGQLGYAVYIAAQFFPSFATLIPAAVVAGLLAAPLWSGKSTYLAQMGVKYAGIVGQKETAEASMARFYSVFGIMLQSSTVIGNFVGSLVLSAGTSKTKHRPDVPFAYCGANFCYDMVAETKSTPTLDVHVSDSRPENVPLLMGIMLAISLQSTMILATCVDPSPTVESDIVESRSSWRMLFATFRHLRDPNQLLIIPLTLWTGFETAFWSADFTYAFITCSLGAENIGYVLMYFGMAAAAATVLLGYFIGTFGRIPFFLTAAGISFSILLFLQFVWQPDPSRPHVFYIMALLWGTSHATISTGLNALYGVVFASNKEAAFSNFRLWQSIGFAIPLAYANFVCIRVKLYILMFILITAVIGYVTVEIRQRRKTSVSRKD